VEDASRRGEATQVTRNGGTVAVEWKGNLYFTKSDGLAEACPACGVSR